MLDYHFCMFFDLTSAALFIYGLKNKKDLKYLWAIGLGSYFLYPIPLEIYLNQKASNSRQSLQNHDCSYHSTHSPIIYSPSYNITAYGLEKLHSFDSTKYGRIY